MAHAQLSRKRCESARPSLIWGRAQTISLGHGHGPHVIRVPFHKVLLGESVVEHGDTRQHGTAIAIPAGLPHRILAPDQRAAAVTVQLDVRRYRFEVAQRLAQRWRGFTPGRDDPLSLYADAITQQQQRTLDVRMERAARLLASGTCIGELARSLHLSEGRLAHLFKQSFGMSSRLFRSWLRLRAALPGIFSGIRLSQVAHDARFADAAHLTRTCRAVLGECPSRLATYHVRLVAEGSRIVDCDEERERQPARYALSVISAALGPL